MNNIFDSHAHYDDEAFDADRALVLSQLQEKGVSTVIDCGCDLETSRAALALSREYPYVYAACGVHAHECAAYADIAKLRADFADLWADERCVAVGEIGLDYHYDFSPREMQQDFFDLQVKIAVEIGKPVIVHDRQAHEDTMRVLRKYTPCGVVHCFSGSVEMARELVELGMYIGLGGATTFKNAKKPLEVAASIAKDRLLIETDCPYMTPVPYRGERNDSSLIPYTAQAIAEVRGITAQQVLDITAENAARLFGITTGGTKNDL